MEYLIEHFSELGSSFIMGVGGSFLVNIIVLLIVGRIMAIETLTAWNALLITTTGYGSFLVANSMALSLPVLGAASPLALSIIVTLVVISTSLDVTFAESIALLVVYAVIATMGTRMGLMDPSQAALPVPPGM